MAKTTGANTARSARGSYARADKEASAPNPAAALIDTRGHNFPWPANPGQRYSDESPWLAVVNARGPWSVWLHRAANPPFIPLCLSMWGKRFWLEADDGLKVFCLEMWRHAAMEDFWGIIWGDPAKLRRRLGMEPGLFGQRLEAMIRTGWLVYLTDAEREAAIAWKPGVTGRRNEREGGTKRGEERAEQSKAEQGTGEQSRAEQDPAVSQCSSPCASAPQIPGLEPEQSKPEQSKAEQSTGEQVTAQQVTAQDSKSQHSAQAQPEGTEPANLPKSDQGAGTGSPRTTGGVRGQQHNPRPPSVSCCPGDAVPISDLLGWGNPQAVEFARGMYEAITGHAPPMDLAAASDAVKGDVGVWVHFWAKRVEPSLDAGMRTEFAERCYRDIAKKRKVKAIRNLGSVAMGRPSKPGIVPGILAAMRRESHD